MSKLKHVIFIYDDKIEALDEQNSENLESNLNDSVLMALRGHKFKSVSWTSLNLLNYSEYFLKFINQLCK